MSGPEFVIRGVLPALMTPFDSQGALNVPMLRKLVAHQIEKGCGGFFICGSTGDGFLLTREERRTVTEVVVAEAAGQVPVIAHVGTISSNEAALIAADARKAGADAVASVPPIYYPVDLDGFVLHMQAISAAADLPTYCYYIPALTGHALGGDQFIEVMDKIPNLVGLKFTHSDQFLMWWIINAAKDRYTVLNGSDQMLVQALITGSVGGIGSTYNYQTKTIAQIYKAFEEGNIPLAQERQWQANRVIQVLFRFSKRGWATERAIMKLIGLDVGNPRPPKVPFPESEMPALRKAMEAAGLFDNL